MATPIANVQDVTVNNLSIRSAIGNFDLIPLFVELTIEESLFRSALTGSIILADSFNLPTKLPIVGEETLDIDIVLSGIDGREGQSGIHIKPPPMHVNSIDSRYATKPKAQNFTLDLASEQFMSSMHSKVSKSYSNQKISDMVYDIYYTYLNDSSDLSKTLNFEPTERIESLIIPNLTPLDAIAWLSSRAKPDSAANNASNYVFFETIDGSSFISINTLADVEPFWKFIFKPRSDDAAGVENLAKGIQKINKYYYLKQFDKTQNIEDGLYSSKLITHDIVRKKITQYDFNGYNDFLGLNHVGAFPVISSSDVEVASSAVNRTSYAPVEEANNFPITNERDLSSMTDGSVCFYPKHNQMYAKNVNDLYDNKVENWKLQRNAQLASYDNLTMMIEVSGNSTLRVGQTVTLELPSPEASDADGQSDNLLDRFLSGTYMITAIKHIFSAHQKKDNKISYTMKVEVVKDALEDIVTNRTSRKED
jgi:hypothetical protein